MSESCFFYVDNTLPESQQCITILCVDCYTKLDQKIGQYWDGALGYGPFDFICKECKKEIHKVNNSNGKI